MRLQGTSCRNEHPPLSSAGQTAGSGKVAFDKETIKNDLTKERPVYKLSCFGPAKNEPSLITGTDVSPEELRFEFYKAKGDPRQIVCSFASYESLD